MPGFGDRFGSVALVAGALLACAAPAAAQEPCTVHILGSARTYPGEEAAWNEIFADFKQQYGCDVAARWEGEWSEIPQRLATARLAGEPVDIVYNGTFFSTLARSGILMELTDLVKPYADRFAPGTLDEFSLGGHLWAVPLSDTSSSAFFYNKTMLDSLGLAPPHSYGDLVALARTIHDQKGIDAIVHRGKDIYYWPMWLMETLAQTSGNQSIQLTIDALEGNGSFDRPEVVAALTALARFAEDGLLTQSTLDIDGEGMRAAFLQQKAAMFYGGTWELAPLRAANPGFEIGVFEFPMVVDTPGVVSQHGGAADNAWSIPSFADPANLPHAAQFLEFITRKAEAEKVLKTYDPLIPSIRSVPPSGDPLAPVFVDTFMPHTIMYLDWIWPSEVNDAISQAIPSVMFGGVSPEDAASRIQEALEMVRAEKEYRYDWWAAWTEDDWAKVRPPAIPEIEVKE